jgi:ABC-2 type transport system permease protein
MSVAFAGFVRHDLRLGARGLASLFGAASPMRLAIIVLVSFFALHAAAWPVAARLLEIENGPDGALRVTIILASGGALIIPWIVAQSMTALTRALFGRSDLELILSSPTDVRSLLAARALAIAIDAVASVGFLLAPLANVAALRGHVHWLALYPALMVAGLMGTGLGVMLAMGLFLAVGPRRARLFCQIATTVVGASFVLCLQIIAILPERARAPILAALAPPANGGGVLQNLVWTPVRAAAGDRLAILSFAALGVAIFALACVFFGERFAQSVVVAAGTPAKAGGSAKRTTRFGGNTGAALRAKERRVVWRDPWLISQLLLQAAYTTPVAVILWRNGGPTGAIGVAFTPALVVIAAQLAGALSWIALSAEDAPDFLATAPVSRSAVERDKIVAIAQPIALILALPLAALAVAAPWAGLCGLLFGAGAIASSALVNLWRQAPSRRGLVLRRHSQSKLVGLMEHLVSILWAVAAAIAVIGSWAAIVPMAAVGVILAINWKWAAMTAPASARSSASGKAKITEKLAPSTVGSAYSSRSR